MISRRAFLAFTLAVYGHLLPRGNRRAVDRLDDATDRNPCATERPEREGLLMNPKTYTARYLN